MFVEVMEMIYVLKCDKSELLWGLLVIEVLFVEVGMGWVVKLAMMSVISFAASVLYKLILSNWLKIGGVMGVGVMVFGWVGMEMWGEKVLCVEGDECRGIVDMEVDEDARGVEEEILFELVYVEGLRVIFGVYVSGGIVSVVIVNVCMGEFEFEFIIVLLDEGVLLDINVVGLVLCLFIKELKW